MIKLSEFLTFILILLILIIIFNFTIKDLHPIFIVVLLVLHSIITCIIISK